MAKVTFDGTNRLILINTGITEIDVKQDIYSAWKQWASQVTNSHWPQAIRSVGGDPLVGARYLGSTFFLMNGWKIRTWEGDHRLVINGNIYSEDGTSISVPTVGDFTTEVQVFTSNLIDTVATGGGGGTATVDNNAIANAVWAKTEGDMMNGTVGYEVFNSASSGGSTASEIADAVWNKKESDMASNSIGSLIFKIHKKIIALLGR